MPPVLSVILKKTHSDRIATGFIGYFLLTSFLILLVEPGIHTYGDAVWYAFAVITTIGFGDLVAVTAIGRILTILLALYGILILALIPGIVTSYYLEAVKRTEEGQLRKTVSTSTHNSE